MISQRNVVSRDKKYAGLRNDIETHLATGGKKAVQSLAEEATTDVLLLAHASQLVLTLSSQMSRLILELSFAVHGYVVPFLAADWAWCWAAWGKVHWAANKRFEISKFTFKFPRARNLEIIGLVLGCIEAKSCK